MARIQRQVRKTLLVVGEGDSEAAFLKHLRGLYCSGGAGVNVTVRNAHGKGPEHVIDYAAKQTYSYDTCAALLDTDIPWDVRLEKKARKARVAMIGSTPCFEGLLLSILEESPPARSPECKKVLQQLLGIDLTESQSYAKHFPKTRLDSARTKIRALDQLLNFFEGRRE